MMRRAPLLLPLIALVASACFATRNDVRLLQTDMLASRAEAARADSARARQIAQIAATLTTTLGALSDSVRDVSTRLDRFKGDTRTDLYNVQQQLLQVQELTGQSQRRINDLRAELERRSEQIAAGTPATPATPGDTTRPPPPQTGPAQLYQIARQQLDQGSYGTARAGFQELLRLYPTSDLAPDALHFVAESYAAEMNLASADSAYTQVLTRYPRSSRAPSSLYKLGISLAKQGKKSDARAAMDRVTREYPQSDEAELAREWLRTNR
jgi:tol-pal system protein YbgF